MSDPNNGRATDSDNNKQGRGRPLLRIIGYSLLALALLLAVYGVVAFSAWERGQALSVENEQLALEVEMTRQLELARQDGFDGNLSLAVRRLEWILNQRPDFPGAVDLLNELQARGKTTATPVAVPTLTPVPTDDVDIIEEAPREELQAIEDLVEEELWEDARAALLRFQTSYPNYNRRATDQMLFISYIHLGENSINEGQVELGLYYFTQAERLGDLPIEIEDERTWSELYLSGINYYGVDWGTAVFYFRDLCSAAPFFQDSCAIYFDALIAYGDQYAGDLDWCPAQEAYSEALQQRNEQDLRDTFEESARLCADATPTPTATTEAELPLDEIPTPPSD